MKQVGYGYEDHLSSACGVGLVGDFSFNNGSDSDFYEYVYDFIKLSDEEASSGCGWYIAGFVDNIKSRLAYEEINRLYKVIYQSPVRINRNSDNEFFFVVFDIRSKP